MLLASCTETYKSWELYEIMQMLFRTLLALYLAHLLADFVFRRGAKDSHAGRPAGTDAPAPRAS